MNKRLVSVIFLLIIGLSGSAFINKAFSSVSVDIESYDSYWQGLLTSPDGNKLDLNVGYIGTDLFVTINNNTFKAQDVQVTPDDQLVFYVLPSGEDSSKLKFVGKKQDQNNISGEIFDIVGNKGNWLVKSTVIERPANKVLDFNWQGKITTPNGNRLDINLVKVFNDTKVFLIANGKRFEVDNFSFNQNKVSFSTKMSNDNKSRLYFTGELIDDWILAGNVFDESNKSGSWIVKKDLDEYDFIVTEDDKILAGAEIVDIARDNKTKNSENVLFKVNSFNIDPSQILNESQLNRLTKSYIGKVSSPDDIRGLIDQINDLYVKEGYVTAKAFLPPQTIKNGIVKITLVEGHVGTISFEGNRFTRDSYIEGKLTQKPDDLFNMDTLKEDLIRFNRRHSVKLKATLKPGTELGAADIVIKADDPNPYHFNLLMDNTGRETVGVLRGGLGFTADSLLGYRDQFSAGYSRARSTNLAYSDYNFPIGNRGTRVGANFSYSGIGISEGPYKDFGIDGSAFNYGGYVSQRIVSNRNLDISGDLSFNFRKSSVFCEDLTITRTKVRNLVAGLNFEYRDNYGRWLSRHSFSNGLDLFGATDNFFKYNGNLTRIHNFGHNILGIFRSSIQLTPNDLPPIEEFQLGGADTVRGYSEGLLLGTNGYFASAEFRLPLPFLPKKIGNLTVRDRVSGVVFFDHGGAFPFKSETSVHHTDYLTSVGVGLRLALTKYLGSRIDWGFALGNREPDQPTARLHFGLEATPF